MIRYRRRLPRRRKGPLPFRYVLLITFILFIISTIASIWIVNKAIEPALMEYAKSETERVANTIIKNAIEKQINETQLNREELSFLEKDESGLVRLTDFN